MTDGTWWACAMCDARYRNKLVAGTCCGGGGQTEVCEA
jgi:hypothetical protein